MILARLELNDNRGSSDLVSYLTFAQIREVRYKNVVSAALVYDERPIMVYYRAVKSNVIAGVMEDKTFGPAGNFYFYLQK